MAQSFVKCEICDERECALICLDCDQYFCQKCKEGHIKTKTTKHHQFLDSGTFQPQYKKLRCTQHEHHFIFFCERCQTLVCPICLPENHQEHRMLNIDKVASIKKNELNETLKTFVTKLNEFESEVNSIQSITEKCKGENKNVIQHVDEQAKLISNVLENQRRCIIKSVKQKAKTEEERISIIVEDLQHCMKEAKEIERKVKLDLHGSDTSLLSNFQLSKSKVDTFEFQDTSISTCPVQFAKYNVPKEELSLLESVFSGNLCGLSEHEERNTLKIMMSKHNRNIEELHKELTNQIQIGQIYEKDIQSKVSEIHRLSSKIQELERQYSTAKQQLYEVKKSNQTLVQAGIKHQKEIADLQKSLDMSREELREKDRFIETFQAKENDLKSQIRNREENMQSLKQEKHYFETRVLNQNDDLMKTKNALESMKQRLLHVQLENSNLGKDIQVLKREKDDLQTRLSSVAGEKLTKGNPPITDLGDPNRPMKIGEKYGELYDNEWNDAMENVENIKKYYNSDMTAVESEEIVIRHLHRLLKCCYKECFEMADGQLQKLGTTLAETLCLGPISKEEIAKLPVCREASIHRRVYSEAFAKHLYGKKILCKTILNDWDYHYKHEKVIQLLMETTFFEKCVYLCWSMAIQDPVMYLDDDLKADMPLDKNMYKEFVKSGDTVVYVVWPALFLHRNGPLLYKGVAQAS